MITHTRANPPCGYALIGTYILWHMNEGPDLRTLLRAKWIPQEVVTSMVEQTEWEQIIVEVIDTRRRVVALREDNDQWSVWEMRMHQTFDDQTGARTFGRASDACFKARGKRPPRWTVISFLDRHNNDFRETCSEQN